MCWVFLQIVTIVQKDLHEYNNLGLTYLLKNETVSCAKPKLKYNVIMIGDNHHQS